MQPSNEFYNVIKDLPLCSLKTINKDLTASLDDDNIEQHTLISMIIMVRSLIKNSVEKETHECKLSKQQCDISVTRCTYIDNN